LFATGTVSQIVDDAKSLLGMRQNTVLFSTSSVKKVFYTSYKK
jgi:hypothetical protein